MDTIISMKDIRLTLATIAKRAEAGERFTVVRDSKPSFRIEPLGKDVSGGGYRTEMSGSRKKSNGVGSSGIALAIPEKLRKMLPLSDGMKVVFYEDGDRIAVRLEKFPLEFMSESWEKVQRKAGSEPAPHARTGKKPPPNSRKRR